jgi:hypothetical protein
VERESCLTCYNYQPFGASYTYHQCIKDKMAVLIKKNVKTCKCGSYEKAGKVKDNATQK